MMPLSPFLLPKFGNVPIDRLKKGAVIRNKQTGLLSKVNEDVVLSEHIKTISDDGVFFYETATNVRGKIWHSQLSLNDYDRGVRDTAILMDNFDTNTADTFHTRARDGVIKEFELVSDPMASIAEEAALFLESQTPEGNT